MPRRDAGPIGAAELSASGNTFSHRTPKGDLLSPTEAPTSGKAKVPPLSAQQLQKLAKTTSNAKRTISPRTAMIPPALQNMVSGSTRSRGNSTTRRPRSGSVGDELSAGEALSDGDRLSSSAICSDTTQGGSRRVIIGSAPPLKNQAVATKNDLKALALENAKLRKVIRDLDVETSFNAQMSVEYEDEQRRALQDMHSVEEIEKAEHQLKKEVEDALVKLQEYEFQMEMTLQEHGKVANDIKAATMVRNSKQQMLFKIADERDALMEETHAFAKVSNAKREKLKKEREDLLFLRSLVMPKQQQIKDSRAELEELLSELSHLQEENATLTEKNVLLRKNRADQHIYIETVSSTVDDQHKEIAALKLQLDTAIPANAAQRASMKHMMNSHLQTLGSLGSVVNEAQQHSGTTPPRHKFISTADTPSSEGLEEEEETPQHQRPFYSSNQGQYETYDAAHRGDSSSLSPPTTTSTASSATHQAASPSSSHFADVTVSPPSGNPARYGHRMAHSDDLGEDSLLGGGGDTDVSPLQELAAQLSEQSAERRRAHMFLQHEHERIVQREAAEDVTVVRHQEGVRSEVKATLQFESPPPSVDVSAANSSIQTDKQQLSPPRFHQ